MKACYKCGEAILPARATWLADLMDKFVELSDERIAEIAGDEMLSGRVPEECFDTKHGIERLLLCDSCTLLVINHALTS